MSDWITADIRQAFQNQRVTLWLGPTYGWSADSPDQERARDDNDTALSRVPWRAIYSDSPVPLLEEAISELEQRIRQEDRAAFRRPYMVAKPGADENLVLTQFLPVYYLNGRLRADNKEDAWKQIPERLRAAYRDSLILGIQEIPQQEGILLLFGFDLDSLRDTLDEIQAFIGNATPIVILSPPERASQVITPYPCATILDLNPTEFVDEIEKRGFLVPVDKGLTAHIVVGGVRIRIDDLVQGPMGRLDESFRIVTAEAMVPQSHIDQDLFDSFMVLNETRDARTILQDRREWAGFASGLFIEREYIARDGKSLSNYVLSKLKYLQGAKFDSLQNITLDIPVHSGAGTTTLLHHVAAKCASEGFPSFVLKQDATEIPFGHLADVLTGVSHRTRDAITEIAKTQSNGTDVDNNETQEVPCLLVFDVIHSEMDEVLEAAHRLAMLGRRSLVLRAIPSCDEIMPTNDDDPPLDVKKVEGKSEQLNVFTAFLSNSEIDFVQQHFETLRHKYNLPLIQRTTEDWKDFQNKSSFKVLSRNSTEEAESLFWIALHYFVTSADTDWSASGVQAGLVKKIKLLAENDPLCVKTLLDISRFSINGLYVDWQHLGRLEGNTFSTEVIQRTKKLEAQQLVRFRWEEEGGANLFRLRHRVMAQLFLQEAVKHREFLLEKGVPQEAIPSQEADVRRPLWLLVPYFKTLDGSVSGDVRLAEEISAGALRIGSQRELVWRYREDILSAFKEISEVIRASSRAINHHYAMALWKTASYDHSLDSTESEKRFSLAIRLLEQALTIPPRAHERDEHPGHIQTSQAYAMWWWARCTEDKTKRVELKTKSIDHFRAALREIPENRYAAYGLARALITICEGAESVVTIGSKAEMISEALDLLQGDPAPDFAVNWRSLQQRATRLIDDSAPAEFRHGLREDKEEAGYLLEAWSEIGGSLDVGDEHRKRALFWLDTAIEDSSVKCTWRTYYLAYKIRCLHSEYRNDIQARYELLRTLEGIGNFVLKPHDLFDLGVMCYLLDRPRDGSKILRKLRISGAYRNIELESQPWWTEIEPPFKPRAATLRVKRVESPYNGWGYVPELDEDIPFRPAHFDSSGTMPVGKTLRCYIRFAGSGAKAVPERFYRAPRSSS